LRKIKASRSSIKEIEHVRNISRSILRDSDLHSNFLRHTQVACKAIYGKSSSSNSRILRLELAASGNSI